MIQLIHLLAGQAGTASAAASEPFFPRLWHWFLGLDLPSKVIAVAVAVLLVATVLTVLWKAFRYIASPGARRRRRRPDDITPLLPADAFFSSWWRRRLFENPWVATRKEVRDGDPVDRDVLAELEELLKGDREVIALCGPAGSGKSRALFELCRRHRRLRLVNTPGYSTGTGDLGRALDRTLRKGQIIVIDDMEQCLPQARQALEAVARNGARLVFGCRYPGLTRRVLAVRRLTSATVQLGRMENVAEVVGATGDRAQLVERVSDGNPLMAVLADRHAGDGSGPATADEILHSMVNELTAAFDDQGAGRRALAEVALRGGVSERAEPVKSYRREFNRLRKQGLVDYYQADGENRFRVKPDMLAERLARRVFFPEGMVAPFFSEVVRRMPVPDFCPALALLINLHAGHGEERAVGATRLLFDFLLRRREVLASLDKPARRLGKDGTELPPAAGAYTRLLSALAIAAADGFQLIEPSAELLDRFWGATLLLGDASLVYGIGLKLADAGRNEEALNCLERTVELAKGSSKYEKTLRAMALARIALIWRYKGELDRALEFQQRSLELEVELGNRSGEARSLYETGLTWQLSGDPGKALDYLEQSLQIERELGDRAGEARCVSSMGRIWQDQGDIAKALEYENQALEINRQSGFRDGAAVNLQNIGSIYLRRKDCAGAMDWYVSSLLEHMALDDTGGPRECLLGLEMCFRVLGRDRFVELSAKAGMAAPDVDKLARYFEPSAQGTPVPAQFRYKP